MMPEKQDQIWETLAAAGDLDGHHRCMICTQELSDLALRWVKSSQDAYVINSGIRQIEKLDDAMRDVAIQAIFGIVALGIGFEVKLALLSKAGAATASMLRGGGFKYRPDQASS